jgi:transcriptional regulator with XRE-family HTH domain
LGIHNEGMSQREIAEKVGVSAMTVNTVLGVQNKRSVKTVHPEDQEVLGVQNERPVKTEHPEDQKVEGGEKRPMAKIPQEEEDDTTSVFTHCTSVEPVANPWVCLTV